MGAIPSEIGLLTKLRELYLWGNMLSSTIPSTMIARMGARLSELPWVCFKHGDHIHIPLILLLCSLFYV